MYLVYIYISICICIYTYLYVCVCGFDVWGVLCVFGGFDGFDGFYKCPSRVRRGVWEVRRLGLRDVCTQDFGRTEQFAID